jgi:uncharacterized membrane protein YgcG
MFPRLAAVVLVALSFLSGAVAEPIPAPTPAPVVVDPRNLIDDIKSVGETCCPGVENIWD